MIKRFARLGLVGWFVVLGCGSSRATDPSPGASGDSALSGRGGDSAALGGHAGIGVDNPDDVAGEANVGGSGGDAGVGGAGGDLSVGATGGDATVGGTGGHVSVGGTGGDAGTAGTMGSTDVLCGALNPISAGTCQVTPGDDSTLIMGDVLTVEHIYRGGQVLVDPDGKISCVGCDCASGASAATKIVCPTGIVSPALINSHDHLTNTQAGPAVDTGERYEHRNEWRQGLNGHNRLTAVGSASRDQVSWGELRFLMGGAVSTVGEGNAPGLLRNLDLAADAQALNQTAVHPDTFPLGDTAGALITSGCAYPSVVSESSLALLNAYYPHVAEGISAAAENEFRCLSAANPGHDVLVNQSAFVQAVGLTAADYGAMAKAGTALIWSPRSNVRLYGDTAAITEAARLGVRIALGSDWIVSGSMNLLRELSCADELNRTYYDSYFTDRQLWLMVTANAAALAGEGGVLGALAPGKFADISIFEGRAHRDYRAVIDAEPKDVVLVMRAGNVLYGDQAVVSALPSAADCDRFDVCGTSKQVCLTGEIGKTLSALTTSVGSSYPAFFCGPPINEPSCVPSRPTSVAGSTIYSGQITGTDQDGDGVPDVSDNCVRVFNPVRPLDQGAQADSDGDGVGDACDVCPFDAHTSNCKVVDPNDRDGDRVADDLDNCPNTPNADQIDTDQDGKGDGCDACPNSANPGAEACLASLYDIKLGVVPAGSSVALANVLVTGRQARGFFVQLKPGDPGYAGADYSGVFVFDSETSVHEGDRVSLTSATVVNELGRIELDNPITVVNASLGESPPDPIVVLPADVATNGSRSAALESVIVRVNDVMVSDIAPTIGAGDVSPTNEFVVNGSLRVDDFLFLVGAFPSLSTGYSSLTGILQFRNGDSKLEPRGAGDFVLIPGQLSAFSPPSTFLGQGQVGSPTFPSPLTVQLSTPAAQNTFVSVTSSAPSSLTVVGGGVTIAAGQVSAPLLVNGLAQTTDVTLSATLNAATLTAHVRVIGPAETPELVALTPPTAGVAAGGTAHFRVILDLPAPAGGTNVALALNPPNAGVIPTVVAVPGGQISATFDYVDRALLSGATVTATLGATLLSSDIHVTVSGGLVINEVDYDELGTDGTEFIELYNDSDGAVSLDGLSVVLVNGSNSLPYLNVDLSSAGALASHQYLVIASNTVTVPSSAIALRFLAATNNIQNGNPDGVALVDTANHQLLDALSYGGAIRAAQLLGFASTVSLVEGNALPTSVVDSNTAVGSLARFPNGSDTDNAAIDWAFRVTPTPGVSNEP